MFTSQLLIQGKYADLLKKYSRDKQGEKITFNVTDNEGNEREIFLFDNYIQGYMVSAMLGILNKKSIADDGDRSSEAKIFADILAKKRGDLETIVEFMLLSNTEDGVDKRIRQAFTVDRENGEQLEKMVTSYARGGLTIIDEWFNKCKTYEDVANQMILFVDSFKA